MKKCFLFPFAVFVILSGAIHSCKKTQECFDQAEMSSTKIVGSQAMVSLEKMPQAQLISTLRTDPAMTGFVVGARSVLSSLLVYPDRRGLSDSAYRKQIINAAAVRINSYLEPLLNKYATVKKRPDKEYIFRQAFLGTPNILPAGAKGRRFLTCEERWNADRRDCDVSFKLNLVGCIILLETAIPYLVCTGIVIGNTYVCYNAARRNYEACLPYGTVLDRFGRPSVDPNKTFAPRPLYFERP